MDFTFILIREIKNYLIDNDHYLGAVSVFINMLIYL